MRRPSTTRSATSSSSPTPTCSSSRPPRRTRSPSSRRGLADNLLTSAALAATCPVIVAPAMNDQMWEHAGHAGEPRAAARARRDGHGARHRRAGVEGRARRRPARRARRAARRDRGACCAPVRGVLDGLRVLVTAGGTREPIDAVRYIGNRSSGRMGFALATRPRRSAPTSPWSPRTSSCPAIGGRPLRRRVDGRGAAGRVRGDSARCDVLLMAAAVVDFRPAHVRRGQAQEDGRPGGPARPPRAHRRTSSRGLAAASARGRRVVGFAAEHGEGALGTDARSWPRKRLDAIVVNDMLAADIGFDAADNEVTIVTADGERPVPRAAKAEIARAVLDEVVACERGYAGIAMEGRAGAPEAEQPRSSESEIDAAVELARRITTEHPDRGRGARGGRLQHLVVALLAEGHVLIEDLPGVGKTTLARALARSLDLEFARIQCTADLLPADVVGTNVFNQREDRFEFRPGPDLRQRRARRRDQPRVAQDAVRPARVHAGAARHRRRPHARARAPVPRARDAEPGRVRGHLPAARGAGRPLHDAPVARLPDPGRGEADMLAAHEQRRPRRGARARGRRRRRARRAGRDAPRPRLRGAAPVRRLAAGAHARRTRASSSAPAPAPASCCCAPRRPARSCRAATTRCPTTSSASPRRCWPIASCSRPRQSTLPATQVVADAVAATPAL